MYFTFKKVNDNLVTIDARTDNGEVKAKSFTNPTRPVDLGTFALFALNLGEAMDADLVEPDGLNRIQKKCRLTGKLLYWKITMRLN